MRVVIADDSYLVREGTRRLLDDGGVDVVASVDDGAKLVMAVDEFLPDAVVTDIRMPPTHRMEGIEAAHAIRARHPGIGIVVLSQHVDEEYAFALLRHGTAGLGYVLKERLGDVDELVRSLTEVVSGRSVIDAEVVDALVARRMRPDTPIETLTPREIDVLHQMAQGRTNAAIAAELFLSESAVEKHGNSIFSKLGLREEPLLHRRVMAVLTYLRGRPA
ncbi:MAG: response regulator transcription factor [Acidimicrobiales bacterium]